jgi:nucleotide-binding universal stress UspA family protein
VGMSTDGSAKVIAGYDGSPDAKRALVWAADLARSKKAPLRVVVAMGDFRLRRVTELDVEWERVHEADLTADAQAAVAALDLEDASLEVSKHGPAPAVLDEADQASVIVMGSRGHGRLASAFVGSVSQHIAQHAACTVVVVREASDPHQDTVVVGVDGSDGGRPALDFAFEHASRTGAPVTALYVSENLRGRLGAARQEAVSPEDTELTAAEPVVAEALRPYAEKYPDVPVHRELAYGSAVRSLSDASEHAALVVVGSRGRGAFESLLLGSVGQGLLHHAHCPVVIAR